MKSLILPFLLSLTWAGSLRAQPGSTSLEEVQRQATFIEGHREFFLGNYEKAEPLFLEVLEKDPENAAAAYALARTYAGLEKFNQALEYARKATDWEPSNPWYWMFLAELYQQSEDDLRAAEVYAELARRFPDNDFYAFNQAYFLVRANRHEDAIAVYDRLEKKMGVNEELTRRKYQLYLGMGNYKKAEREIQRLIQRFPDKPRYRYLLATFYETIDRQGDARKVYRQILERWPEEPRARLALATEAEGGADARLVERLEPVFRNPNVNIDAKIGEMLPLIQEAVQNDDRPRMEALLPLARLLEEVHPGEAKAFAVTADLLFHSGRIEEAVEHYRRTLELDDSVYQVWEQLLNALAQLRRWKELTRSAEEALDLFPNQASLNYLYGLGLLEQGKARAAVSTLEQALLMAVGLEDMRFRILGLLGRAHCEAGQLEAALRRFEEARRMNAQSPLLLAAYARCLLSNNQFDPAQSLLEEATRLAPNHPAVLETRGDALFLQGDVNGALQLWQKALEQDPQNETLKRKISSRSLE